MQIADILLLSIIMVLMLVPTLLLHALQPKPNDQSDYNEWRRSDCKKCHEHAGRPLSKLMFRISFKKTKPFQLACCQQPASTFQTCAKGYRACAALSRPLTRNNDRMPGKGRTNCRKRKRAREKRRKEEALQKSSQPAPPKKKPFPQREPVTTETLLGEDKETRGAWLDVMLSKKETRGWLRNEEARAITADRRLTRRNNLDGPLSEHEKALVKLLDNSLTGRIRYTKAIAHAWAVTPQDILALRPRRHEVREMALDTHDDTEEEKDAGETAAWDNDDEDKEVELEDAGEMAPDDDDEDEEEEVEDTGETALDDADDDDDDDDDEGVVEEDAGETALDNANNDKEVVVEEDAGETALDNANDDEEVVVEEDAGETALDDANDDDEEVVEEEEEEDDDDNNNNNSNFRAWLSRFRSKYIAY